MENIRQLFYTRLIGEDLDRVENNGYEITTPKFSFGMPVNEATLDSLLSSLSYKLNQQQELLYKQVTEINYYWKIYEDSAETINKIKEDPWLQEHFFNEDYSLDIVLELISGSMYVPSLQEHVRHNTLQSFDLLISAAGLKPEEVMAFDLGEPMYAFMKIHNDKVEDHVWLLDSEKREVFDLSLSVDEYLIQAYRAKLFHGWQDVYLHKSKSRFHGIMNHFFPILFAHVETDLPEFNITT